jgi:hypothetical protein
VTPERIQKWKIDYLKRAETNPASRRAARPAPLLPQGNPFHVFLELNSESPPPEERPFEIVR